MSQTEDRGVPLTPRERMAVTAVLAFWHEQVLSTAPVDKATAETAVEGLYRLIDHPAPRIVWVPSPVDAANEAGLNLLTSLAPPIVMTVMWRLARLSNRWKIPFVEIARRGINDPLSPEDAFSVAMAVNDGRKYHPRPRQWPALDLVRHVTDVVTSRPLIHRFRDYSMRAFLRGGAAPMLPALIEVASDALDIPEAAELMPFAALAKTCGYCLPMERVCYLSERPEFIMTDAGGNLHADEGPAVAWPGGAMPMWRWRGLPVAEHVMAPVATLDARSIRRERSVILRDIMIERFGLDRFIREGGAKPVQQDEAGVFWVVRNPIPRRRICAVEVINGTPEPDGSYRRYFLRVPPTVRTARGAVAWSYGLTAEQYRVKIRT